MLEEISNLVQHHQPISREHAEWLFQHADSETLVELSDIRRRQHHPNREATYVIMGIVNYTNICVANCDYCSFFKFPHQKGGYQLNFEEIRRRLDHLLSLNAIWLRSMGFNPNMKIRDHLEVFEQIHTHYPDLTVYDMTVAEFMFVCKHSKIDYATGANMFLNAGTQWITGGGAEILDNDFRRRHSPGKYKVEDYFEAQATLLENGLSSTATMVIGFDESLSERMNHLERLRDFQAENRNMLPSFLCWVYKPDNNRFNGTELTTKEYLRWIAICRIYLHNFKTIRTSVLTKNANALEALRFGANDFDMPIEDEVTQLAGATISLDFSDILKTAHKYGFEPTIRGALSSS